MNTTITEWNSEHTSDTIPLIAESDVGYKDVLTGLRFYPALLVTEGARNISRPYFCTYTFSFCIAHREDDITDMQKHGEALLDCFEDTIRKDTTLNNLVVDCSNMQVDIGVVSGVYVAAINLNAEVDLGSYDGMGGQDTTSQENEDG